MLGQLSSDHISYCHDFILTFGRYNPKISSVTSIVLIWQLSTRLQYSFRNSLERKHRQSYVSINSKPQHPPGNPWAFDEILCLEAGNLTLGGAQGGAGI